MKNILVFGLLLTVLFIVSSCKKDFTVIDEQLIVAHLQSNNLTAQKTESGLYYIIDSPGTGGHPDITSTVEVNYTGYFLDGTIFDSSNGNPVTFPLSGVIRGWQEGIPLFQRGGEGTLILPSNLAYGSNPPAGFPANAVLMFDVELIDFN